MKELSTDLLILGGGAAGLSAAAAACARGIDVTVCEANAQVGGNGLFPRGIFAADSVLQRKNLIFVDKDAIFSACMKDAHYKLDGRIVRALIEKSGDTISWLTDMGVEFTEVIHHLPNQSPEVFHITDPKENTGRVVIRALRRYCEERKVTFLTSTRAMHLLTGDDGKVCGAVCTQKNPSDPASGTEEDLSVTIHAKKVIVCCGGFAGNKELISRFYPGFKSEEVPAGGGMRHPGDGVRMAMEAGADIEGHFTMEIAAPKIAGHAPLNLLLGKPYNVWVNSFGQRFAGEEIVYHFAMSANACMRQPGSKMWVIFNEDLIKKTLADGRDRVEEIHIPENAEEMLPQTLIDAAKDGTLAKSDTIEGLASFIGCDKKVLCESLSEYNAACASRRDGLFAKPARYLLALDKGPYYTIAAGCDMLITHGGIRVNASFEALNAAHLPLGNLYVAGVDFGGADADVYNVEMSGHGFGFAVNSGRIAGEHAAKKILSE